MKQGIPKKIELAELILDINRVIPLRGLLGDRVANVAAVFGRRVEKLKRKRELERLNQHVMAMNDVLNAPVVENVPANVDVVV